MNGVLHELTDEACADRTLLIYKEGLSFARAVDQHSAAFAGSLLTVAPDVLTS